MTAIVEPQLLFCHGITDAVRAYFAYTDPADAIFDPRGRVVRFAPWRRTVMHELPDATRAFCKVRSDSIRHALREMNTLASDARVERADAAVPGQARARFRPGTGRRPGSTSRRLARRGDRRRAGASGDARGGSSTA